MSKERIEPTLMENMIESLTNVGNSNAVTLVPKDSTDVDMYKCLLDNAYGLLSKNELTIEEITMLGVLLKAVYG